MIRAGRSNNTRARPNKHNMGAAATRPSVELDRLRRNLVLQFGLQVHFFGANYSMISMVICHGLNAIGTRTRARAKASCSLFVHLSRQPPGLFHIVRQGAKIRLPRANAAMQRSHLRQRHQTAPTIRTTNTQAATVSSAVISNCHVTKPKRRRGATVIRG